MAVHIQIDDLGTKATYTVGGSPRTEFPAPFAYFENSDLVVTVDGGTVVTLILDTDYTVAGTAVDAGFSSGTVTLDVAVTNVKVVVSRVIPIKRTTDFPDSGPFKSRAHNTQFDKIIAMIQQLATEIGAVPATIEDALALLAIHTNGDTTVTLFPTRLAIPLATVSVLTDYIRTAGFAVPGLGGGVHKRISTPATVLTKHVQSGDGAWWELAEDAPTPYHYGAIADGTEHPVSESFDLGQAQAIWPHATSVTDTRDWLAVQAMLNEGVPITASKPGRFYLNKKLDGGSISQTIKGLAMASTEFYWPAAAATAGMEFAPTIGAHLKLADFTLLSDKSGPTTTRKGIQITRTEAVVFSESKSDIHNVSIKGLIHAQDGWLRGLAIVNPFYETIKNFNFSGISDGDAGLYASLSAVGIELTSTYPAVPPSPVTCAVDIDAPKINWCGTAIYIERNIEGVSIRNQQVINCNTSVHHEGTTNPGQFNITGGHCNVLEYGIRLGNVYGAEISGLVVFQMSLAGVPAPAATDGVRAHNCEALSIHDNVFRKFGTAPFTHISMEDTTNSHIHHNVHLDGGTAHYIDNCDGSYIDAPIHGAGVTATIGGADHVGLTVRL